MSMIETISDTEIVDHLNSQWPAAVKSIGGRADAFDQSMQTLHMSFVAIPEFCHSESVVQGGYITAMLDAGMAFSVIGMPGVCDWVATLEIKVSFMSPGRPGRLNSIGRVVHRGRSIGYLSAELYQEEKLIATATSTVKLIQANKVAE